MRPLAGVSLADPPPKVSKCALPLAQVCCYSHRNSHTNGTHVCAYPKQSTHIAPQHTCTHTFHPKYARVLTPTVHINIAVHYLRYALKKKTQGIPPCIHLTLTYTYKHMFLLLFHILSSNPPPDSRYSSLEDNKLLGWTRARAHTPLQGRRRRLGPEPARQSRCGEYSVLRVLQAAAVSEARRGRELE